MRYWIVAKAKDRNSEMTLKYETSSYKEATEKLEEYRKRYKVISCCIVNDLDSLVGTIESRVNEL